MQSDNTTESILRELDKNSPAELSALDMHWKQMETTLSGGSGGGKTFLSKNRILFGAGAILLIVTMIAGRSFFSKNNTDHAVQRKNVHINAGLPVPKDSTPDMPKTTEQHNAASKANQLFSDITAGAGSYTHKTIVSVKPHPALIPVTARDNVSQDFNNSGIGMIKKDSVVANDSPDRAALLQRLLLSLNKKAQEFLIDNRRDTVLYANEGTAIYIPAGSFYRENAVLVSLKEYYQEADIIMNRLTTLSNGEQLSTGGMIDIRAMKNGNPLILNKDFPVKVFIPGISASDSMQVFYAENKEQEINSPLISQTLNWQLSTISIDSPVLKMFIRAVDLRDDDIIYRNIRNGSKTKAVFIRSRESVLSKEELTAVLKKKYGQYYDVIRVRRQWDRNLFFKKTDDPLDEEWGDVIVNSFGVGDTAELLPSTVRIYKLTPIDTVYEIVNWIHKGSRTVRSSYSSIGLTAEAKKLIGEKYSIEIDKLGMINCDRFYRSKKPKRDFIVDLKDSTYNYYSMLVLPKVHGYLGAENLTGSMIAFKNIPENEPMKLVCIGINKNGESILAVKKDHFSSGVISDLQFEKISGAAIKDKLEAEKN